MELQIKLGWAIGIISLVLVLFWIILKELVSQVKKEELQKRRDLEKSYEEKLFNSSPKSKIPVFLLIDILQRLPDPREASRNANYPGYIFWQGLLPYDFLLQDFEKSKTNITTETVNILAIRMGPEKKEFIRVEFWSSRHLDFLIPIVKEVSKEGVIYSYHLPEIDLINKD